MSFIGSMPVILTNSSYFSLDFGSWRVLAVASVAMARWTSTAMTPVVPLGMSLIRASPAAAPDLTPASGVQADKDGRQKQDQADVIDLFMIGTSLRSRGRSSYSSAGIYHRSGFGPEDR